MRILDSAALAALDSGRFHARNGFAVTMPGGVVAFWDDAYDIAVEGITYLRGAGGFTISAIPSAFDLGARNVDISLSGIDARVAADIFDQPWHQRPVSVARFVMAAEAPTLIYARTWFTGYIDTIEWKEKPGGTSELIARCEDINRELGRKNTRTRSPTDQRQLYPGDAFFDGTVAAVNTEMNWGRIQEAPVEQPRRKFFGLF